MQDEQCLMQLCKQASIEQDPDKLIELIREINTLLEEKRGRVTADRPQYQQQPGTGQDASK